MCAFSIKERMMRRFSNAASVVLMAITLADKVSSASETL
jgi:hypothetical protein